MLQTCIDRLRRPWGNQLRRMHRQRWSDPRDRVYGLLGLLRTTGRVCTRDTRCDRRATELGCLAIRGMVCERTKGKGHLLVG